MKSDNTAGVDVETITQLMNISPSRFYQMKLLTGTPADVSRGRYPAAQWCIWYIQFLSAELERRGGVDGPESAEIQAAKLRLISARVERIEMENSVAKGYLLEVDTIRNEMTRRVSNCKARLLGIPSRLGPELVNRPSLLCEQRLTTVIEEALSELDGDIPGVPRS